MKYKSVLVFGPYRSGTHYLAALVAKNFLNSDDYISLFKSPHSKNYQSDPNTLNIFIYRNFQDTAKSLFKMRKRMGVSSDSFEEFTTSKLNSLWDPDIKNAITVKTLNDTKVRTDICGDFKKYDMTLNEYWYGLIEFWKELEITKSNVLLVSYEDLLANFQTVLEIISDKCCCDIKTFTNINKQIGWIPKSNKKPKFFIGYPKEWIEKHPDLHSDNVELYNNIQTCLKDNGYLYDLGEIKIAPDDYDIVLSHHGTFKQKNVWNLKKSYIPGYSYWDRSGYSGWAELTTSEEMFVESQKIDYEVAKKFFDSFAKQYIESNTSKYSQTDSKPFHHKNKFIFVACQKPHDTVSKLARIKTEHLPRLVQEVCQNTEYDVVVKFHPMHGKQIEILNMDKVHIVDNSIHDIIPHASAVITVNSGVGLESMLHRIPVYTTGVCEYQWITRSIKSKEELKNILDTINDPFEEERNVKFFYYLLNTYYVKTNDIQSIQEKLMMCITEWENS